MTNSPTSHLGPSDAAAAVRSFPRRFRSALAEHDDDDEGVDPDELARRVGADGRSAVDHLLAADGVLSLVGRALEQARVELDPVLHPALADLGAATWDDPHSPLDALLDQLGATASDCASRIEAIATPQWGRQVRIADADRTRQLLDLVGEAVSVTAGHLRAAERTLDEVR